MSDRALYPRRPPFFAPRYLRLLVKICAMQEIGQDAFALLTVIVTTEDAKRYAGPVTFHNGQLLPLLGFKKWERLDNARRIAAQRGFLFYEAPPPGRRDPGVYWATIPKDVQWPTDAPIDESGDLIRASYLRGYADAKAERPPEPYPSEEHASGGASPESGYGSGYGCGYGGGEPSILSLSLSQSCGASRRQVARQGENQEEKDSEPSPEKALPELFEQFWKVFPARGGRKRGKAKCLSLWRQLIRQADRQALVAAAESYAAGDEARRGYARDPERFIKAEWWREWIGPAEDDVTSPSQYPDAQPRRVTPPAAALHSANGSARR